MKKALLIFMAALLCFSLFFSCTLGVNYNKPFLGASGVYSSFVTFVNRTGDIALNLVGNVASVFYDGTCYFYSLSSDSYDAYYKVSWISGDQSYYCLLGASYTSTGVLRWSTCFTPLYSSFSADHVLFDETLIVTSSTSQSFLPSLGWADTISFFDADDHLIFTLSEYDFTIIEITYNQCLGLIT